MKGINLFSTFVKQNKQTQRKMKATIENTVKGEQSFVNRLLYVINKATTREELTKSMYSMFSVCYDSDDFIYGFGGSHMWVANKQDNQRIIFVAL